MHMLPAIGGGFILLGLGMVIKGFGLNNKYTGWLCLPGIFLVVKGAVMLGWRGINFNRTFVRFFICPINIKSRLGSTKPTTPKTTIRPASVGSHCLSSVALQSELEPCPLPSSKRALGVVGLVSSKRDALFQRRTFGGYPGPR